MVLYNVVYVFISLRCLIFMDNCPQKEKKITVTQIFTWKRLRRWKPVQKVLYRRRQRFKNLPKIYRPSHLEFSQSLLKKTLIIFYKEIGNFTFLSDMAHFCPSFKIFVRLYVTFSNSKCCRLEIGRLNLKFWHQLKLGMMQKKMPNYESYQYWSKMSTNSKQIWI